MYDHKEEYTYTGKGQIAKVEYTGIVDRTDYYTYAEKVFDYVSMVTTGNYNVTLEQDVDGRHTKKTVTVNETKADSELVFYTKSVHKRTIL